ncbi:hypothetical protein G5I_05953 [Acromyrmex echinatior]|uniref:Uncharacterized protein n=1 Tax=Acromyrmex echinatior TaxID=103372 RepID=F4WJS1_ACREC|nr:hypothetical protein G5I_05953 [Acromyrmex echinatior]
MSRTKKRGAESEVKEEKRKRSLTRIDTEIAKETALQFGADPTMHPHSEWRSPSVHPEITAQEARSANACFLSASSLSSVPQRLDTPLRRHAASCTSNNRLVKVDSFEASFNDSRVRSTSSSRHAAFSRGDLEALACARGLTANWRKSVLLSRCAKCAGRIVGRYYVPEMLVRSGTYPMDPSRSRPNDLSRWYQSRSRDSCSGLLVEVTDLSTRRVGVHAATTAASSIAGGRDSDRGND